MSSKNTNRPKRIVVYMSVGAAILLTATIVLYSAVSRVPPNTTMDHLPLPQADDSTNEPPPGQPPQAGRRDVPTPQPGVAPALVIGKYVSADHLHRQDRHALDIVQAAIQDKSPDLLRCRGALVDRRRAAGLSIRGAHVVRFVARMKAKAESGRGSLTGVSASWGPEYDEEAKSCLLAVLERMSFESSHEFAYSLELAVVVVRPDADHVQK